MAKKPRRTIKISLKNGTQVTLMPEGQIWQSTDGIKEWHCVGFFRKGTWNDTPVRLDRVPDGFRVSYVVMALAKKFGIKQLRLELHTVKLTRVGWLRRVKYGYVPVSRFPRLLAKRKTTKVLEFKQVLLKEEDLEIKGE